MGEIKVKRGKKNHADIGRFISYNGDTGKIIDFFFAESENCQTE